MQGGNDTLKPSKWISIIGEYEFSGDTFLYKGEAVPGGNFICDLEFGGGSISSTITFEGDDPSVSAAGVILYYHPASGALVVVQLGGTALVSVQTFVAQQWTMHDTRGSSSQIVPGRPYNLQAQVYGSRVRVSIDGIYVLDTNLLFPLPSGQPGIWASGSSNISFADYEVDIQLPKLFVVMQFTDPFNELYSDVIKPVGEKFGFIVARADDTYGPGIVIADIAQSIREAKVVVADITPLDNPNVFWEVGYAHALRIPTILLAERNTPLPFDVSPFRTLFYDNTIPGKSRIEDGLRQHLLAIQAEWSAV